jgi:hypothetical protein
MENYDSQTLLKNYNKNSQAIEKINLEALNNYPLTNYKIYSNISSDFNSESTKIEVAKKIKDYFEDPSKYFDSSNIIVGKKPKGPKYDKNNQIIPRSVVGLDSLYEKRNIEPGASKVFNIKFQKKSIQSENLQLESNFSQLDKNKVSEIFRTAKERIISGKLHENKIFECKDTPKIIGKKNLFDKQEKLLEKAISRELSSAKLSRALSAKTHKDNNDLLINKIDNYVFKKQILKSLDSKRPIEEKYGDNGWVLTLRREKEIKHIREAFLNIGSDHRPIWRRLIEYPTKEIEIIKGKNLKPDKSLQKFFKNDYLKNALHKAEIDLEKLIYNTNFQIKGENILEKESRILEGEEKIYKLYKDPDSKGHNIEPLYIKSKYI